MIVCKFYNIKIKIGSGLFDVKEEEATTTTIQIKNTQFLEVFLKAHFSAWLKFLFICRLHSNLYRPTTLYFLFFFTSFYVETIYIHDQGENMASNLLKLNTDKTAILLVGPKHLNSTFDSCLDIDGFLVRPSPTIQNLEMAFDSLLTF